MATNRSKRTGFQGGLTKAASLFDDKWQQPDPDALQSAPGETAALLESIEEYIVDKFGPLGHEWKIFGKKAGWTLALVHDGRRILHLIPQSGQYTAVFTLGKQAVSIAHESKLPDKIKAGIAGARKYAEGRSIRVEVDSALMRKLRSNASRYNRLASAAFGPNQGNIVRTSVMPVLILALVAACASDGIEANRSPQSAAETFLELVDHDNYEQTWIQASTWLQNKTDASQWAEHARGYRQPLGTIENRQFRSVEFDDALEDMPAGKYAFVFFDSSLENGGSTIEIVGLVLEDDSMWRVIGYQAE